MRINDKWAISGAFQLIFLLFRGLLVYCKGITVVFFCLPCFSEPWNFSSRAKAWVPPISFIRLLCRSEANS